MEIKFPMPVMAEAPPESRKIEKERKEEDGAFFSKALEKARKKDTEDAEMNAASQAASQQAAQSQPKENAPEAKQAGSSSEETQAATKTGEGAPASTTDTAEDGKVTNAKGETFVIEKPQPEVLAAEDALAETVKAVPSNPAEAVQEADALAPQAAKLDGTAQMAEEGVQPAAKETSTAPAVAKQPVASAAVLTPTDTASSSPNGEEVQENLKQTVVNELGKAKESTAPAPATQDGLPPAVVAAKTLNVESSVFEPARLAEARSAHVIAQVKDGLETLTKTGQNSLHLQLQPENLGKIDLRLMIRENGMHVVLTADASQTGAMLERHLPELRQALVDAGVNISGLSVGQGGVQDQSSAFSRWQEGQKKGSHFTPGLLGLDADPGEGDWLPSNIRSTSRWDYRV